MKPIAVDKQAGGVDQAGDHHPGGDKTIFAQAAAQQEHTPQRALVTGNPAKKTAEQPSERQVTCIQGKLLALRKQFHHREADHQHPDGQVDRHDLQGVGEERVAQQRRHVGQPEQQPGAAIGRQDRRDPEAQHYVAVGKFPHQIELEKVIQEMHYRRQGYRDLRRKKQREGRQQQGAQSKPGKQRQPGGE